MKFKIYGVSRESGKDVELVLEADNKEAAEKAAYELNILVYVQKTQEVQEVVESDPVKSETKTHKEIKQNTGNSDQPDGNDRNNQPNRSRFEGPPINCRWCGGKLKKERKATGNGMGCLLIIVGLILISVVWCIFPLNILIGIVAIVWGLYVGSQVEGYWRCKNCDELFPRKVHWYDFG